jgi:hypothetical protein
MPKKYGVLRIIATINKIIAWLVLVLGVLGGCVSLAIGLVPALTGTGGRDAAALAAGGLIGGLLGGIGAIFVAVLYFLVFYAFGEMIYLLIDLEENTRLTSERLREIAKG